MTEPPTQNEETGAHANASQNTSRLFFLLVLLAAIAAITFAVWLKSKTLRDLSGGLAVARTAPQVRVAGWLNGEPPADRAGKVVVINAWFTTCPYCHSRAPEIVEAYNKFHDRGVVFIGLTYEPAEMLTAIRESVAEMKMAWPNGYGALDTLTEFHAEAFPSYWVIGADGRIAWNGDSPESLDEGIERALVAAKN